MDFGWNTILDILQPRALPFFFSLPYTAYWSNKDKTVMVLQKGKIVDLIFHHFVQSSILKEGMFWRRPGLIKGKGAAIPPAVTSSHLKITTTKNLNFKVSHSLVRQKFLLRWYSSQLYSWRVLRVLDGWRIVAAPWPFQVSSSSSSLTSPLRIERSAIEQRLSWAPPLLDYPPNTCQLSIEQRDNDISAKHCISLWAGIWGFQCASIREALLKKKMFSFGHCTRRGGRGETPARIFLPFFPPCFPLYFDINSILFDTFWSLGKR